MMVLVRPGTSFEMERMMEAVVQGKGEWVLANTRSFAEAGVAKAQIVMGILCQAGIATPQDGAAALRWYKSAAKQNEAVAWKNMGTLYLLGLAGVKVDKHKAHECFSRARELEYQEAGADFQRGQPIH